MWGGCYGGDTWVGCYGGDIRRGLGVMVVT